MNSLVRDWLARTMAGRPPTSPLNSDVTAADLVAAAQINGVTSMVDWRLQPHQAGAGSLEVRPEVASAFANDARSALYFSMLFEAESVTVLRTLQEAGIPGLLLKGNALAYWAYPHPHLRSCSDVDVLVPSRDAAEALASRLCSLGYERSDTTGELVAYELMCRRFITEDLQPEIDVHWRLTNSVLFANAFSFDELMADSIPLPALGTNARGLGPVHACIHACVHRALNLSIGQADTLKWLYDIVVLVEKFGEAEWHRFVSISTDKSVAGVVLSALEAAASTFHQTLPAEPLAALRYAKVNEALDSTRLSDWRYMQQQTMAALPSRALRLRWIWQRIFPSKGYMRYLYCAPNGSYHTLMALRVARLFKRLTSRSTT